MSSLSYIPIYYAGTVDTVSTTWNHTGDAAFTGSFDITGDASVSGSLSLGTSIAVAAIEPTAAFDLQAVGAIKVDSSTSTITIGGDDVDQNILIGSSGDRTITVGRDASVKVDVNALIIELDSAGTIIADSTTTTVIGSGTTMALNAGSTMAQTSGTTYDIQSTGNVTIDSSAGTIGIGTDSVVQNINIGTNAGARTITLGNDASAKVDVNALIIELDSAGTIIADSTTTSVYGSGTTMALNAGSTMAQTSGTTFDIQSTGNVTIDSSGGTIGLGTDSVVQNINIGTNAGARTITVGNDASAKVDVNALIIELDSAGTVITDSTTTTVIGSGTTMAISAGSTMAQTSGTTFDIQSVGAVTIDASAGTIGIGTDAVSQNMNIGTAGARVITVGNNTGVSGLILTAGTGDIVMSSGDDFSIDCAGTLGIESSAGIISIGGDADAFDMNIGTGAAQRDVTIGNVTGTTSVALNAGTGGIAMASTGAGDIVITSSDTFTVDCSGVLELNSSAGVIGIGNDAIAQNINIGIGGAARVITIGNVTAASQVVLNSGTAGVAINTTGAGDFVVTSADTVQLDCVNALTIESSAGTIGVGVDAVNQNINIGTAGDREITIGNATGRMGYVASYQNTAAGSTVGLGTYDAAGGAQTITAAEFLGGYCYHGTAGGAVALTLPTAAAVQAALLVYNITSAAGLWLPPIFIEVSDAQAMTITAAAGGTVHGPTVAVNNSTAVVYSMFSAAAAIEHFVIVSA